MQSILRFDHHGIAYAMVSFDGRFHETTVLSFQVTGNYNPHDIGNAVQKLIDLRNTHPHDSERNYFSEETISVGKLDFHYRGNGYISAVVNKARVLFCVEANTLKDFAAKCLALPTDDQSSTQDTSLHPTTPEISFTGSNNTNRKQRE